MELPEELLCSKTHEFVYPENNGYVIGLTDYAVEQLGDIVFVELPAVDTEFQKGDVFGTVESVKAASEIYMPVGGKVVEINEQLIESPELLNESPMDRAWLIKIESSTYAEDSEDLLEYDNYRDEVE